MQVKTVLCPVKTVSKGPETLLASLSDGKVYRNNRRLVLGAKDEKVHSDCYQCKVQKPESVMVSGELVDI